MSSWPSPEVEEVALAWCVAFRVPPPSVAGARLIATAAPDTFVAAATRMLADVAYASTPLQTLHALAEEGGCTVALPPPFSSQTGATT